MFEITVTVEESQESRPVSSLNLTMTIVAKSFFNRDASKVGKDLLGKVLRKKTGGIWLSVQIIETEAYYKHEKGSHASLGFTKNREALFMPPGTIYMYYARGGDSLNFSCRGAGNAVLIKSGIPYLPGAAPEMIRRMQTLNPIGKIRRLRPVNRLCSGQTLLCKSLGIKVPDWNRRVFDQDEFFLEDVGYCPEQIIRTTRLGIPIGRDDHLLFRFIDFSQKAYCTKNPLAMRNRQEFFLLTN